MSVLVFPLLLALNSSARGQREPHREAGRRGHQGPCDTGSAAGGMQTLGGHVPQAFQWTPEMGILKRTSPQFLTLATN